MPGVRHASRDRCISTAPRRSDWNRPAGEGLEGESPKVVPLEPQNEAELSVIRYTLPLWRMAATTQIRQEERCNNLKKQTTKQKNKI